MILVIPFVVLALVSAAFAIRRTSVHRRHARADQRERGLHRVCSSDAKRVATSPRKVAT
jgi:hypothetical protein